MLGMANRTSELAPSENSPLLNEPIDQVLCLFSLELESILDPTELYQCPLMMV
jgi:hypothetical protein